MATLDSDSAVTITRLLAEVETLRRERAEAHAREAATAEVLGVISRSPADLQTVLDAIVERAARLLKSPGAAVTFFRESDALVVSSLREDGISRRARLASPLVYSNQLAPRSIAAAVVEQRQPVMVSGGPEAIAAQFPDIAAPQEYERAHGMFVSGSIIDVPLMQGNDVYGLIAVYRPESDPYSDRQIALLETFADQAVIALENARLFDEVQQRNRDLAESLEQQTATAEALQAISRTAFDLQTVLDTLTESAARLLAAPVANLFRRWVTCRVVTA
jgi:GAF domain-containing protein